VILVYASKGKILNEHLSEMVNNGLPVSIRRHYLSSALSERSILYPFTKGATFVEYTIGSADECIRNHSFDFLFSWRLAGCPNYLAKLCKKEGQYSLRL